jgi:hypothetical protein
LVALLYPLVGAIAYAPWVAYQQFYAIPFLVGTSVIVGMAMTGARLRAPLIQAVGTYTFWVMILVVGATEANSQAALAAASQRANYRLIDRVSALRSIDTVFIPSANTVTQSWQGLGATLGRYAAAVGKPWPVVREISCSSLEPGDPPRDGTVIVHYFTRCPRASDASPIVEWFSRPSLRRLKFITDSVRIDIAAPEHSRPSGFGL